MLNLEQKIAISHYKGPALVLAVPGAGKTTVLIHRTANLIINHKVNPKNILSLTFSRPAANDMKRRFTYEYPRLSKYVTFSTIHSFCYTILRDYSYKTRTKYTLIEDSNNNINKYQLLRQLYFKFNNDHIQEDRLDSLINYIGYIKNMLLRPEEFLKNNKIEIKNFLDIFNAYESYKSRNNLIDFDDMLSLTYNILLNDKEVLSLFSKKFEFIQVDEGQDTSKIQLEIIKLISRPKNNIFIVADDDQSIYGFRGAYPEGLFNFKEEFKDLKLYFMEENYRSSKNIVSASNKLIQNNSRRYKKNILTNNGFLNPVNIVKLDDLDHQYQYIYNSIKDFSKNDLNNTAILFRNNLSAIGLINFLEKKGINFSIRDKKFRFFNHWLVENIINFLKFSLDTSRIDIYEKIYYMKKGYISKKQLEFAKTRNYKDSVFQRIKEYPRIPDYYIKTLNNLEKDFKRLSKLKPKEAIEFIKNELEYLEYLRDYSSKFGYSYRSLVQMLNFLSMIGEDLNDLDDLLSRLDYLSSLSNNSNEGITLSTIHSVKGLEFDNVFLVDLIDGDFPSIKSIEDFQNDNILSLEEERRLFYVAITRAKYNLNLLLIDRIDGNPVTHSRFVNDIV